MSEKEQVIEEDNWKLLERLRSSLILVAFLVVYWILAGVLLWWSYDITPNIRGGYYQVNQAIWLVAEMGLIVTFLTTLAWLLVRRHKARGPGWRVVWKVAWRTWVSLFVYAGAILARLQFGRDNVPLDDSAFLPVLGHVNSHFFSEFNWLIFLLYFVPVMGCVSGVLYYLQLLALKTRGPLSV